MSLSCGVVVDQPVTSLEGRAPLCGGLEFPRGSQVNGAAVGGGQSGAAPDAQSRAGKRGIGRTPLRLFSEKLLLMAPEATTPPGRVHLRGGYRHLAFARPCARKALPHSHVGARVLYVRSGGLCLLNRGVSPLTALRGRAALLTNESRCRKASPFNPRPPSRPPLRTRGVPHVKQQ